MKLSDEKKGLIFKKLASSTLYDVGVDFGLDKHYANPTAVRNKVYAIYRDVANNHEKYSIPLEIVDLVTDAVSNRKVAVKTESKIVEKHEALVATDIKSLTISGRDVAGKLIAKKLDYLEAHPKALQQESLVNLGKIFGILFDKAQIIQGQATEHIAVMSKIDSSLTPAEALDAVLRSRESTQAEKHG